MCLLLCSLFPEDHEIYVEELVRYACGLELFEGVGSVYSIEDVRSEVVGAIEDLKGSCLLLNSGESHVKMHDIVRGFALWIASQRKEISFSVKSKVIEARREDETFEPYTAILFKTNRTDELPEGFMCPNLKILELLGNCSLHERLLAPEALQSEINLQTFHLERCRLGEISILGRLTKLRTLHLEWCNLPDELSILGKSKKLQVLSFSGSDIKELPEEIGDLNNLKLFDLSYCNSMKRIPCHLIQRLSELEEVYLGGCRSLCWGDNNLEEEQYANLSELNSLHNLNILSLDVEPKDLPENFVFQRLQRYDICIHFHRRRSKDYSKKRELHDHPFMRSLEIEASKIEACRQLFQDLESLNLKTLEGPQSFVPSLELELDLRGLSHKLTSLGLESWKSMKCLVDTTELHASTAAFFNLVNLSLKDLPELEQLCYGHHSQGFLEKLKTLLIDNCKEMVGAIPMLQNLETLKIIRSCDKMQALFQTVELGSTEQALSQNASLKSLKFVEIDGCNKLTYLFPAMVANSLGQLETLKIRNCLELEEIIQETEVSDINLQSLREVFVEECNNLTSLSSLSNGHILESLKTLDIRNCSRLEHTFPTSMAECLPQLSRIALKNLPQLKNDIVLTLPSLQYLTVADCPQLVPLTVSAKIQEFVLQGMTKTNKTDNMKMVPAELRGSLANMEYLTITTNFEDYLFDAATFNLKKLTLRSLPELRVLWKGPIQVVSFQNLTELIVKGCGRLRYIFSPTIARKLPQLSYLVIEDCDELEYFIEKVETSSQDHQHIRFRNLNSIKIRHCAQLKSLFPVSVAHHLPKLEYLGFEGLSELEEVFEIGDEANVSEDKEKVIIQLPRLGILWLQRLPKLKSFSPMAHHFVLPSLEDLLVRSCPNISTRFSLDSEKWGHAITETIPLIDESIVEECATSHQIRWPIGDDVSYWKTGLTAERVMGSLHRGMMRRLFLRRLH
ncbi:hypothetical protein PTKIN_Ptkin14bG0155800 [Pterospermum kingtungense]